MAVRRITVLLSEEEYTQVRSNAGLVPLSRWFKSLALGVKESRAKTNPIPDVQSQPAIRADARRESVPTRLAAAIPGLTTAAKLSARCVCGELRDLHLHGTGRCQDKTCACTQYRMESIG